MYPFFSERLTVPQQLNKNDCGIFVIEYVARFLRNPLRLFGTGRVMRPADHQLEPTYFNRTEEFDRDAQLLTDGLVKTVAQLNSWFDAGQVFRNRRAALRNFFKGLKNGNNEAQVAKQALNNIYNP